jgi:hypothetical protein
LKIATWIRIRIQNADPDPTGKLFADLDSKTVLK